MHAEGAVVLVEKQQAICWSYLQQRNWSYLENTKFKPKPRTPLLQSENQTKAVATVDVCFFVLALFLVWSGILSRPSQENSTISDIEQHREYYKYFEVTVLVSKNNDFQLLSDSDSDNSSVGTVLSSKNWNPAWLWGELMKNWTESNVTFDSGIAVIMKP